MNNGKTKLVSLTEDVTAIVDNDKDIEKYDPDKTVYDLRIKNIKKGQMVVLVNLDAGSDTCMIMHEGELMWVHSSYIEPALF